MANESSNQRLCKIELDEASIGRGTPDQEHERAVAIYDLLEANEFGLASGDSGPFTLRLALQDARLVMDVRSEDGTPLVSHHLSLTPFRTVLKDYFAMCDRYFSAIRTATPAQIEVLDMGRRGLHNEGAEILKARLDGKLTCDFSTARRLFTLVTALHWRG